MQREEEGVEADRRRQCQAEPHEGRQHKASVQDLLEDRSTHAGADGAEGERNSVAILGVDEAGDDRVGLERTQDSTGLFCTDASQTGDVYIGVEAFASVNNITMPPRHWYTLAVAHERFTVTRRSTS